MKIYKVKLLVNANNSTIICRAKNEFSALGLAISAKMQDSGCGIYGDIERLGPPPLIKLLSINKY